MIRSILVLAFLIAGYRCFSQQNFYYEISVTSLKSKIADKVIIEYEIGGLKYQDSLTISKNQYTLKRQLVQPVAAMVYTDNKTIEPQPIFLANNSVKIEIDNNAIVVDKTKLQNDFLSLTANDRIRPKYFPLYGELNAKNDTIGLKKLSILFDSLRMEDIKLSYNYFIENGNSPLSLLAFSRFSAFSADYSKVENDYESLPLWAKESPDGKNILSKIQGAKSAQIGTKAFEFAQLSSDGEEISFDSFKGKYVLVDFWASWCGPCRKEHPYLIKAYEEYASQNFTIISISLDSEKNAWIAAIEKDGITWTQLSDLRGQQNEVALKYGVQAIPANFLISPEGIIIDKDIKGQFLYNKLKNVLKPETN